MRSLYVKTAAASAGILVVVAGLLVAPSLVDWTEYRTAFATRLSAAVGRPVSIDGDVDFVLLPRPAFNADEVRIGGAVSDDYVGVGRLSARLAFLPLLEGRLQFRELVLRRAEARVTRTPEGGVDFLGQRASAPQAESGQRPEAPAALVDLDVDRVIIDGGSVAYQDVANGVTVDIGGIDARIEAHAQMPAVISGTFVAGRVPLEIEASLGRVGPSGERAVAGVLKLVEADAVAKFNVALVPTLPHADLRGDINFSGTSVAALLSALGADAGPSVPGALRKPFSVTTKLHGTTADLTADITDMELGGASAKGAVYLRVADKAVLDVKMEFGAIDLTAWRFAALEPAAPGLSDFITTAHAQDVPGPEVSLPKTLPFEMYVDLSMPILSYGDQTLRGGIIKAGLVGHELTISDASVELPGATRVKTYGFVRFDDRPVFEGATEVQSGNIRAVLDWLGVNTDRVPPGRLTSTSLRAAVQGTSTQLTLADIDATVDTSDLKGRVSWTAAPRPTLGLDLTVSALNVDAYTTPREVRAAETAAPSVQQKPATTTGYGVTPKLTHFGALADMDADVRLQIDNLTAGGIPGGKVGLDIALKDNALNIRSASFDNIAGATAWFSGGVSGFGISPRFNDVQFDVSATDIARFARVLEWDAPPVLRGVAPVSLTGVLNGGFAEADVAATLKAAGTTVHADGKALNLDQQPHVTLNIDAAQPSYAAMIKAAGLPWPTGTPDPGSVKFAARVTYEKAATKISDISMRVGENTMGGSIDIADADGHKTISGTLTDVNLAFDRLWPKAPAMTFSAATATRPVALVPSAGVWSEEPFDWSLLKEWRGDVQVSGRALTVRGVQAQDFKFRLALAEGGAEVADWNGRVFGAPGQLYIKLGTLPVPSVQGEIAFLGGDLGAVAGAINGTSVGLKSGGKVDFAGSFRMQGGTPAAFASDVSGSGTVKLSTTEAGTGPVSALLGAVAAANQLEGLSGQKGGLVTLESRFSSTEGRIKIEDATVASKSYGGAFSGTIDLPRWQVDMTGKLRLEVANSGGRPVSVPIAVKGTLDLPNITLLPGN